MKVAKVLATLSACTILATTVLAVLTDWRAQEWHASGADMINSFPIARAARQAQLAAWIVAASLGLLWSLYVVVKKDRVSVDSGRAGG